MCVCISLRPHQSHLEVSDATIDLSALLLTDLALKLAHLFALLRHAAHVEIDGVEEPVASLVLVWLGYHYLLGLLLLIRLVRIGEHLEG